MHKGMMKASSISICFAALILLPLPGTGGKEIRTSISVIQPQQSLLDDNKYYFGGPTCSSHPNCTDCTTSSFCHWCGDSNTGTCKGKEVPPGPPFHGCLVGAYCTPPPPTQTCTDHKNCFECSSSSSFCHWCESTPGNGTCHVLGSLSGCAKGTDCHAIHRCQRLEPEPIGDDGGIFSKDSFHGVGPASTAVLGILLGLVICCSTICFAGASFLKAAVDDIVGEPSDMMVEDGVLGGDSWRRRQQQYETIEFMRSSEADEIRGELEEVEMLETPLLHNGTLEEGEEGEDGVMTYQVNLPPAVLNGDSILTRSEPPSVRVPLSTMSKNKREAPRGSSIKSMYFGCQLCYLFTLLTAIILFTVGMSYSPRQPEYNVCTNELAWKSIVEGMASIKMSASFDLLISVYNPNRFEVDLRDGHGQFKHYDQYVGSFDIPEGKITARAISDIVVKVTFTPDKWDALSLTAEYYEGKLKLVLGGHAMVTIPALGNYKFDAKFDDIHVNVNDPSLDDTHLCACPGWKRPFA